MSTDHHDPTPVVETGPRRPPRGILLLSGISVLAIAGWAIPAVLMANKGLALEDEGTYLLSYRWWHDNPYFLSGSQYFYGPVFEALGEHTSALRLLRLVMAIACNGWFGWTFCRWLARHRGLEPSRATLVAGTLLLTAAGGQTYLWSPLTPGYYDLTADATLVLVTLWLMRLAAPRRVPVPLPLWVPLVAGLVSFVLVLTKWPAVTVVLLTQGAALIVLWRGSRRSALRYAVAACAGVTLSALAFHLFLVPLDRVVPILRQVSSLSVNHNHSPGHLLVGYLKDAAELGLGALLLAVPSLVAALVGLRMLGGPRERWVRPLVVGGVLVTGVLIPLLGGWRGGADHGRVMVTAEFAVLLTALVVAMVPRRATGSDETRGPRNELLVVLVLLLAPLAQAAGTDVALEYVAGECLAMWLALVLLLATRPGRSALTPFVVTVNLTMAVVTVALICGTTTLMSPFKTTSYNADTARVEGVRDLRVSPTTARQYAALGTALGSHVVRGETPMFTLNGLSGLTFVLGGVPIGSTWTDPGTPERTAGVLELACRNGDVDRSTPPVLLFSRPPYPVVVDALRSCGFDFPAAYRRLTVPGGPPGITAYVPR